MGPIHIGGFLQRDKDSWELTLVHDPTLGSVGINLCCILSSRQELLSICLSLQNKCFLRFSHLELIYNGFRSDQN